MNIQMLFSSMTNLPQPGPTNLARRYWSAHRVSCFEDDPKGVVRSGDLRDVGRTHLARLRTGSLGHEPLRGRRDGVVFARYEVPRWNRFPGRRARLAFEGGLR